MMYDITTRDGRLQALRNALVSRILVLDGAAGTMIQAHQLSETDFRGERFADWAQDLRGNNDVLQLTQPRIIRDMHEQYLAAGADIISTNTFSSTSIAQADYAMEEVAYEMNVQGARIARQAADVAACLEKPRFVVGVLGPTNRTASISPDVNDPGARNVDFDTLVETYQAAARALIEGGVDILLIETIFDTLNAKACIFAVEDLATSQGVRLPLMLSVTITDQSGRTLSGQTTEAFWNAVAHAMPLSVGINCALGPDLMRPYVAELSRVASCYVSAHPNAGLPNAFGTYDETPESMTRHLREWMESGLLNIVGGCCGTTPDHIASFAIAAKESVPRLPAQRAAAMRLCGLEPFTL